MLQARQLSRRLLGRHIPFHQDYNIQHLTYIGAVATLMLFPELLVGLAKSRLCKACEGDLNVYTPLPATQPLSHAGFSSCHPLCHSDFSSCHVTQPFLPVSHSATQAFLLVGHSATQSLRLFLSATQSLDSERLSG